MGYRMKGSPAKLGTIKGTTGHSSALKGVEESVFSNIPDPSKKKKDVFSQNKPWDLGTKPTFDKYSITSDKFPFLSGKSKINIGPKRNKFGVIDLKAHTSLQKDKKTTTTQTSKEKKLDPSTLSKRAGKYQSKIDKFTQEKEGLSNIAKTEGWSDDKLLKKQQSLNTKIQRNEERLQNRLAKEKYGLDRLEREVSASILAGIATGKPTVMRMDDEITDAETEEAKKSATTDYELEDFTFKPTYSRFIRGTDD